jgi:hypothetical protein
MAPAASTIPVTLFFGVMALGALGWFALYRAAGRRARNAPLTPADAFDRDMPEVAGAPVTRPRLSPGGWVAALFACVTAVLGTGITWATLAHLEDERRYANAPTVSAEVTNPGARPGAPLHYRFEVAGHAYEGATHPGARGRRITVRYLASDPAQNRAVETTLPAPLALVMPLLFDLAFLVLALHLRRDYVLLRRGQATQGRLVGYAFGRRGYSVLAYYDFCTAQRQVVRGSSFLANYTSASAYLKTTVGSCVEVLYVPGRPACNGLRLGLWWRV